MRESIRLARLQYNEDRLTEALNNRILVPETGCLIHRGKPDTYGTLYYKGKQQHLHRLAFIRAKGEIKKGDYILHTCNRKECSNPKHLYAGTQSENIRDAYAGNTEERLRLEQEEIEKQEQELFELFK